MKALFTLALLAAALICSACSEPRSLTGPSSLRLGIPSRESTASHTAQLVPFKGSFEGTQMLTSQQPPFGFVNGSGTGNGTHLGLFTVEFPHTVNFATRAGTGTYTFTAANGDMLTADFTGQAQGGPIVSIVEHAAVTGGTGRFAGATGSFVVRRRFDPASGTTEGSFEGTIAAPGASNQ